MSLKTIIIIIAVFLILFVILIFNRLVSLRNRKNEAWFQIDVQIKRRADLVPNLVETVKGYARHEKETFEKITQARGMLQQAGGDMQKITEANNMLSGALKSLFAVVENYPELKANQNFLNLQTELAGIEDRIAYARQFYNEAVRMYNEFQQIFPVNLFAPIFGHKTVQYFEITDEQDRKRPEVKF
ncbi:MAG: LemA family protein [Candidatus Goldbacteria bacterium]|nr:LemA family protein [Candidatus Goldiibacteriota bacterium]